MSTPAQQGDPFPEAAGEAVQTAVMSVRLVLAIAEAVRRHQQKKKKGEEDELLAPEKAVVDAKEELKDLLPADISAALMKDADWPQMAQQLMALKKAGVELDKFLPRVGEIAVSVRDQVAANEARVAAEGTGRWEKMLRETLPAGMVREAILSSPAWPDMAATLSELDAKKVDVRGILVAAHGEGLGVDQAMAKLLAAGEAPTASRDAMLSWGPLTEGLDLPPDLNLSDRAHALRQLAISPAENERFTRMVRDAMPGRGRDVDLMVASKQWPVVAARMAKMESEKQPIEKHLEGLMKNTSWEKGQGTLGTRLLQATSESLRRPPGAAGTDARNRVSTTAARLQSSTVGPTKAAASKRAAPAERGVAAHRETGPAKQGKTR
ncbi:hypothetical protein ACODT4_44530 [Streptomyces sp. 2.9]|uniref:hypothetical protein n=1 Tax=Streptomyces tritrimontium TaxID=3406573 RepID=UPI003BB5E087